MTVKTTGLELKTFYTDLAVWNDHDGQPLYWVDDIGLAVNDDSILDDADIPTLADSDQVDILSGFVYAYEHLGEVATLEDYFQRWRGNHHDNVGPGHRYRKQDGIQGSLLES
jgi:hypothetical protein